jgi:hypothetical protein
MARYLQTEVEDRIADLIVMDQGSLIIGVHLYVENDQIMIRALRSEE